MNGTIIPTLSRNNFNQLLESQKDTKKMITSEEVSPSAHVYQRGNYLIYNNQLYKVTAAISIGDTLSTSTNLEAVNVGEELKATAGGGSAGSEVITPPTLTSATSFVYDGTSKSLSFSGYDEDTMIMDTEAETNAGHYVVTVALKNGNNTWSDTDDNIPKSYQWEITKAQATLSMTSTPITLNDTMLSITRSITKTGDGTLRAVSSDNKVCSVTLDGTSLTITRTNPVFDKITITVSLSETSNYSAPVDKVIQVNVRGTIVSWSSGTDAQIVAMVEGADRGVIDLYDEGWKIGDTRTVYLSAMSATGVGESHVAQDVEFVLMHYRDMNLASATASGRTKCNFVVGMKGVLANGNNGEDGYIYPSNDNRNGWRSCNRRTWCNNVFRYAIPSTLRSIFKQFTHNVGYKDRNNNGYISLSTDYFSLPTEKNVFGVRSYALIIESNATDNFQFEWYKIADNRIKKSGTATNVYGGWTCSAASSSTTQWCYINNNGNASQAPVNGSYGISPFGVI